MTTIHCSGELLDDDELRTGHASSLACGRDWAQRRAGGIEA